MASPRIAQSISREILLIEDDVTLNRLLSEQLLRIGCKVVSAHNWAEAQRILNKFEPSLILLDVKLPDCCGVDLIPELIEYCPIVVLTAYGTVDEAVKAVKAGASEYFLKPITWDRLEMTISRVFETTAMKRNLQFWQESSSRAEQPMVGDSAAFMKTRRLIEIVASADTTVLIQGESGVGKELVASAIHHGSDRASANYVAIDCCTLHENLFESELFGHERGSFTGAEKRKKGLIELAEGGTVLLDEIGEISASIQAKLLRVLETGKFRRLGGLKDLKANVRFIAATNKDLKKMSDDGSFRSDLFYRLSAFIIPVSPLRERRDDIAQIAQSLLASRNFMREKDKSFSRAALGVLSSHEWPGNVRELRNVVERAALMSGNSSTIHPHHLSLIENTVSTKQRISFNYNYEPTLDEIRDDYLYRMLDKYNNNRSKVAQVLGVSERSIYRLIQKNIEQQPAKSG